MERFVLFVLTLVVLDANAFKIPTFVIVATAVWGVVKLISLAIHAFAEAVTPK